MNIVLILFLGFILRLFSLNQSLWLDEATTAQVSQMPIRQILDNFLARDFHPPLYYFFMRGWVLLFGPSEISLRVPSIIFALFAIYLVYKIYVLLVDKKHAWIAPALLASSGLFVYYSQEARAYMFSTLLVCLSVFSFVKTIRKGRIGDWILFALTLAALCLSDYLPCSILLVFWVFGWGMRKNKDWIKKFVASHIILAVSWLWWLPYFLKQLNSGLKVSSDSPAWWNILGKFSFKEIALIPTKFIIGRVSLDNKILYALVIFFLIVLFGLLILKSLRYFKKIKFIYLWLFLPLVLVVLLSFKIPVLTYFRMLFVLPAFYLLAAVGISSLKKPIKTGVLVFVLLLNLVSTGYYLFTPRFHKEDWRGLVGFLRDESKGHLTQTVFPSRGQMEAYKYYSSELPHTIGEIERQSDIIWLVRYVWEISDPGDLAQSSIIDMGYTKTSEYDFNGIPVFKYERIK